MQSSVAKFISALIHLVLISPGFLERQNWLALGTTSMSLCHVTAALF